MSKQQAPRAISPTSAEVIDRIKAAVRKHPGKVTAKRIGTSTAGSAIYAAVVTDKKTSNTDKQNVCITGGFHGNEESGRAISLSLLDWLVTPAAKAIRANQRIFIVPNVNPDGADIDCHYLPSGAKLSFDFGLDGPKYPESAAVHKLLCDVQPELYVDLHARGHAGWSYDMVMFPVTREYTEDEALLYEIATEMTAAGEAAGSPHVMHTLRWWHGSNLDGPEVTKFAYRQFKSLVLLTETAEINDAGRSLAHRAKVGLARMKTLLAYGNKHHPKLYYRGYPNYLVAGSFYGGLVAIGKTATARRASRVGACGNLDHFSLAGRGKGNSNQHQRKERTPILKYAGKALSAGIGLQYCNPGRLKVKSVHLNGKKLRLSETNGFYTWRSNCATYTVVAIPKLKRGSYAINIAYE